MVVSPTIKHMFSKFNNSLGSFVVDNRIDITVDHITMEGEKVLKGLVYDVYLLDMKKAYDFWNLSENPLRSLLVHAKL